MENFIYRLGGMTQPRQLHLHLTPSSNSAHPALLAWGNATTKANLTNPSSRPHSRHCHLGQYPDDMGTDRQSGCDGLPQRRRCHHDSHCQQLSQLAVHLAMGKHGCLPASPSPRLAYCEPHRARAGRPVYADFDGVLVVPVSLCSGGIISASCGGLCLGSLVTGIQAASPGRKHGVILSGLMPPPQRNGEVWYFYPKVAMPMNMASWKKRG